MIKPLTNVSVSVLGNEVAIADGDKNGGKTAYGQLLAGEDVSVTDESRTLFIPYHAVDYAVIERSSETVEDPVDSLCKSENDGPELCDDIVLVPAAPGEYVEDGYTAADFQENLTISGDTISGTVKCPPLDDAPPLFVLNVSGSVIPEGYEQLAFFGGAVFDADHLLFVIDNLDTRAIPAVDWDSSDPLTTIGVAFIYWTSEEDFEVSDCKSVYQLNLTIEECGG